MLFVYPKGYEEAIKEIGVTSAEWNELEALLTPKEVEILEVIIIGHTKGEYKLFFNEMIAKLEHKGKLPNEYRKFLTK